MVARLHFEVVFLVKIVSVTGHVLSAQTAGANVLRPSAHAVSRESAHVQLVHVQLADVTLPTSLRTLLRRPVFRPG